MEFYIFIICLAAGFTFALGGLIFGHFLGGSHDLGHVDMGHVAGSGGHAESGFQSSDMPGISPYNPTLIASFVAAFGGLGIVFYEIPATRPDWISVPLALAGAFAFAGVLFFFLRGLFRSTQGSSESRVVDVIGLVAEVITPIPENGVGEIAYVQKGARYSAPAREQSGEPVPNGRPVKIVRVAGSQFYVSMV